MPNVLFGAVCLDYYTNDGAIRPGCGILHNAYHLQQLGAQPCLLTRIGAQDADHFLAFFRKHGISVIQESLIAPGTSASIQITLDAAGEAHMRHFRAGVWQHFQLTVGEEAALAQATNLHMVMLNEVAPEFLRLHKAGKLQQAFISADFLALQHFSLAEFTELLAHLQIAFIGWRGDPADPRLETIRQAAATHHTLVIVTLGSRGIQVFDALTTSAVQTHFFPVEAIPVQGNTNGCGDTFISYFLAEYWQSHNLAAAINRGKIGGALATAWPFALPVTAYG